MERFSNDQYDVTFISPAFWATVTKLMSKLRSFQYFRYFINECGCKEQQAEILVNRASDLTENLSQSFREIDMLINDDQRFVMRESGVSNRSARDVTMLSQTQRFEESKEIDKVK